MSETSNPMQAGQDEGEGRSRLSMMMDAGDDSSDEETPQDTAQTTAAFSSAAVYTGPQAEVAEVTVEEPVYAQKRSTAIAVRKTDASDVSSGGISFGDIGAFRDSDNFGDKNLTKEKTKNAKSPKKKKKKAEHNGECYSTTCYDHPFWYRTIGYRRCRVTIWQFVAFLIVFVVALSAGIASIPPPVITDDTVENVISVSASMTIDGVNATSFGEKEEAALESSVQQSFSSEGYNADDITVENVVATDARRRRLSDVKAELNELHDSMGSEHLPSSMRNGQTQGLHGRLEHLRGRKRALLASTDSVDLVFDVVIAVSIKNGNYGAKDTSFDDCTTILQSYVEEGSSSTPSSWAGTSLGGATIEEDSLTVADSYGTVSPSMAPTTSQPTIPHPSTVPTPVPSPDPTTPLPSPAPSKVPTPSPTITWDPTTSPTPIPTPVPTMTPNPTPVPTAVPSPVPTTPVPSPVPTSVPTTRQPSQIPTPVPSPDPTMMPSLNVSDLGEMCETTNVNGVLQPLCAGSTVCVHLDQNTAEVARNGNTSQCIECSEPQWSYDCKYWDWQTLDPATKICNKTCDAFNTKGKKDYYVDEFNNFNPKVWYKDLPCVDYASWTENGEMVISLQQYTSGDDGTYGGCVYSKQVFGSGNYSVDMTPFSTVTDGYISTFYMYSENLTYAEHDEIDFEFRSGIDDDETDKNVWTNVFHTTDSYQWGKSDEIEMDNGANSYYDASYEGTNSHNYRIEYVEGEFVRWFVDGVLVRTETEEVPTHKMAIRFSVWYNSDATSSSGGWSGYLNKTQLPVYVKYQKMEFTFDESRNNCDGKDGGTCACGDFAFDTCKASCGDDTDMHSCDDE